MLFPAAARADQAALDSYANQLGYRFTVISNKAPWPDQAH
jgi:hypothetical protein